MDLEKRSDESQLQYHKRLVYGKLVDKTLADVDYTELAEYAYGQPYSSDTARRMFYGSKRTLELMDEARASEVSDVGMVAELDDKIRELQQERKKFYDQRREYNKLVARDARADNLEDRLVEAAERLPELVGCLYDLSDYPNYPVGVNKDTEAVLVLCDWHYGMVADNIWNRYDTEICKRRVHDVVEAAIQRIQLHGCTRLHVLILGDLIHGAIHTSARVASEELVCEQIMNVAEILAQSIDMLSQYVDTVEVYTTYGNHARTVQHKADNIHRDNMERLIPWWLQQRLRGRDDIIVHDESETEFIYLDVGGYGFCASHGDLDGVKQSSRLLPTLYRKKYGKDVDYVLLADRHHRESFEELGVSSMICGALCGTDEYANNKRLYSAPEQTLLIVRNGIGVDAEYHLKVQ